MIDFFLLRKYHPTQELRPEQKHSMMISAVKQHQFHLIRVQLQPVPSHSGLTASRERVKTLRNYTRGLEWDETCH